MSGKDIVSVSIRKILQKWTYLQYLFTVTLKSFVTLN